jgi:hypothetical protein
MPPVASTLFRLITRHREPAWSYANEQKQPEPSAPCQLLAVTVAAVSNALAGVLTPLVATLAVR